MYFDEEGLSKLVAEYEELDKKQEDLIIGYLKLELNDEAIEYVRHGFLRRLSTLSRCIKNIFEICPPEDEAKLSSEKNEDLSINLQSFVFNVFGAIDNLAWIWVKEFDVLDRKGKKIPDMRIGLRPKNISVLESFSESFRGKINDLNKQGWFELLENFRHSLAHRIPLYVPPYVVTGEETEQFQELENVKAKALEEHKSDDYMDAQNEQDKLGKFVPLMVHSIGEGSPNVVFHAQIITDWNTVCEIANYVLDEINQKLDEQG